MYIIYIYTYLVWNIFYRETVLLNYWIYILDFLVYKPFIFFYCFNNYFLFFLLDIKFIECGWIIIYSIEINISIEINLI